MSRKPGSPRQQSIFKCEQCDFTSKEFTFYFTCQRNTWP